MLLKIGEKIIALNSQVTDRQSGFVLGSENVDFEGTTRKVIQIVTFQASNDHAEYCLKKSNFPTQSRGLLGIQGFSSNTVLLQQGFLINTVSFKY